MSEEQAAAPSAAAALSDTPAPAPAAEPASADAVTQSTEPTPATPAPETPAQTNPWYHGAPDELKGLAEARHFDSPEKILQSYKNLMWFRKSFL